MSTYEELPCSIYLQKRIDSTPPQEDFQINNVAPLDSRNLDAFERVSPNKQSAATESDSVVITKKKSCLSSTSKKVHPPHPALRKKTVAFGRTVNVSQTVEGTSRNSRKALSRMNKSDEHFGENDESEDWKRKMEQEMHDIKKMMEDSEMKNRMLEEQEKNRNEKLDAMQKMMVELVTNLKIDNEKSENKENRNIDPTRTRERSRKNSARQIIKTEGRIPEEVIPILERRIQVDPIFRQQIDDVLADAEYESSRPAYSPLPSNSRYYSDNSAPNAMMKETLTVERSIQFDNAMSIDSRQWLNSANRNFTSERDKPWQPNDNDGALHSTYQPGASISYYPSAVEPRNRRNNGYIVENISDHEDNVEYHAETKAEKARRVREKYSKRQ